MKMNKMKKNHEYERKQRMINNNRLVLKVYLNAFYHVNIQFTIAEKKKKILVEF